MAALDALLATLSPQLDCDFELQVVQQPIRARMCGFGDKDRRPITPPVIVRLVAYDKRTHEVIPPDEIDSQFLLMAADLRTADDQDANIIRLPSSYSDLRSQGASVQSSTAPSPVATGSSHSSRSSHPSPTMSAAGSDHASPTWSKPSSPSHSHRSPSYAHSLPVPAPHSPHAHPNTHDTDMEPPSRKRRLSFKTLDEHTNSLAVRSSRGQQMEVDATADEGLVPNLIGALHANAFTLRDLEGKLGTFFVFHDLSVRTEGTFKLRFRFMSIGVNGSRTEAGTAVVQNCSTQSFTVSSAKKFEGMLDPTDLSKCFAKQGVRIPTRKVARAKGKKEAPPPS